MSNNIPPITPTKRRQQTPNPVVFGALPFLIVLVCTVIGMHHSSPTPKVKMAIAIVPRIIKTSANANKPGLPVLGYGVDDC